MHFLLDLCGAREDTHFPFFSADLQSFPLRYARTLRCYTALLFLLFRRHVSTNSFECFYFEKPLPFQNMSINKSYICWVRKENVSYRPVLRSGRAGVHYRKACYDLHQSSNSITTHTLDARKGTGDDTHQHPELVLIKPPSRKPLKTWSDSVSLLPHPRPITLLIL